MSVFSTVATLAVKFGPTLVRGVSSLLGGSGTANKVADIVENVGKVAGSSTEQTLRVEAELAKLPPEQLGELAELKTALEAEQTRREAQKLADKQHEHQTTQETIRAGDNVEDEYVRHTRPRIARQSWLVTALYVLVMAALQAFGKGAGPSLDVAAFLMSGAWVYMGLRTADGFAPYQKASGHKVTGALAQGVSALLGGRTGK